MAKDPYHYFRIEAHELAEGLGRGLLELDKDPTPDAVRKLLRLAHTLKGAARVVKQMEIGDLAHKIEDLLSPHREEGARVGGPSVEAAHAHLDEIRSRLALLDAPAQPDRTADAPVPRPVSEDFLQSVRLNIDELDELIGGVTESIVAVAALQQEVPPLRESATGADGPSTRLRAAAGRLQARAEQAMRELEGLRAATAEMRLVSAQVLVTELERSARDAAQSLGRTIEFSATGADTRIDAAVLSSLRGALRHVVRNAVAHGIEDHAARRASGKATAGKVRLVITRSGHRAVFVCRDDGRGMDIEAIRSAALKRGLVSTEEAAGASRERLLELLLHGGVSTSRSVSQVAGRGVGLDVVRETLARLKGEVAIRTEPGKGTEVELTVPVSLSSLPALVIEAGGVIAFAPLDSVRRTLRVKQGEISRSPEGERVRVDDHYVPFSELGPLLGRPQTHVLQPAARTMVVFESGGAVAAVGVDSLRGVQDVILRRIPAHVQADPVVAGVALDETGVPRVVLAPAPLTHRVQQARGLPPEPKAPQRPPVLVIDDSLTTRMLEQSILESAGYTVDLAVSAEEALEKAAKRRYGLFIVDVEMPGMNGFEFIARTRQMPDLNDIPSVLVTSRSDPDDKRRGRDVGARAYVVKSEFNQQEILRLIRGLIG